MPVRDVVPPRPPPRRQPGPARGLRRRRRAARCSCSTRRCGGRPGAVRRAYLARLAAALDASLRQRQSPALGGPRRPGPPGACWPRARSAPTGCTSPPTSAPTAAAATTRVEQALAEHGIELVRTGSPYAVAPGPGDQRRRASPTRSSRRSRGPGPSTAGAARSTRRRGATLARRSTDTVDIPDPALPDGLDAARGRRGGGAPALAGVPRRAGRRLRRPTATGPASTAPRRCRCT